MSQFGQAGPGANPELSATFTVELDGIDLGAFKKASIDGSEWATMSSRTGVDNLNAQSSSATRKIHIITLEKDLVEGGGGDIAGLVEWHDLGSSSKKTGAIVSNDRSGNEVFRITFKNSWCKKVTYPQFDADEESGPTTYTFEIEASELIHEAA